MAVTVTKKYVATDGKEFSDYQQAQAYDRAQAVIRRMKRSQELRLNQLKSILCNPNASQSGTLNLALDLLNKPDVAKKLRDALNSVLSMHRHFPKV